MAGLLVILLIFANINYQEMVDDGLRVYHGGPATLQAGEAFWTEEHCNYRPPGDWMSFKQECHTDVLVMPHIASNNALHDAMDYLYDF